MISSIHNSPAYDPLDLAQRVNYYLDMMLDVGTTRANTVVDVTCDRVGLSALKVMLEIKKERSREIKLQLGAYSPLGFKDSETERWDLLVEGAEQADFLGGFSNPTGSPMAWLVHVISPSTYDEARFEKVLAGLVDNNIGVICCPSAAVSMRQLRPLCTPTYNSIARVLEMLAAGVHVCIGSDNIADICSPAGTPDLTDELFVLSNAIRFFHVGILAKLAAGVRVSADDRQFIKSHLKNDAREIVEALERQSRKDC